MHFKPSNPDFLVHFGSDSRLLRDVWSVLVRSSFAVLVAMSVTSDANPTWFFGGELHSEKTSGLALKPMEILLPESQSSIFNHLLFPPTHRRKPAQWFQPHDSFSIYLPWKLTYPLKLMLGSDDSFPFNMVPFQGAFVHFRSQRATFPCQASNQCRPTHRLSIPNHQNVDLRAWTWLMSSAECQFTKPNLYTRCVYKKSHVTVDWPCFLVGFTSVVCMFYGCTNSVWPKHESKSTYLHKSDKYQGNPSYPPKATPPRNKALLRVY